MMELTPFDDVDKRPHIELLSYQAHMQEKMDKGLPPDEKDEEIITQLESYRHVCWCNPELIYCDDVRGNEVWLHKRIQ